MSRSLTLDDEDVEIDIDVSESRIDDVGTVLNSQSLKNSMDAYRKYFDGKIPNFRNHKNPIKI